MLFNNREQLQTFKATLNASMVADRRLDNVLRILLQPGQADPNSAEASRVYASAATVLATLTNPLNVSLLSTQILISPAIWQNPDGLRASLRTFGVFQSATLGKIESPGVVLGVEDWLNALVRGANQNVPRWKHLLLLGAVLSADQERSHLPRITRGSLEDAFCRAVNMSLSRNVNRDDGLEADVLSLVLSHAMESLSRRAKAQLNYNALLPFIIQSIYYSQEGFQSGYFLPSIDHDIVDIGGKLAWPSKSNSFLELQERTARPLFVAMGSLARLAAAAIKETHDILAVHSLLDNLQRFAQIMSSQWRNGRLSTIPASEEERLVNEESLKGTTPLVWQILKSVLFTTTLILQELTSRIIEDPILCDRTNGPFIASKILDILRSFYFITSRIGPNGFSSYNFVYYTAIDVLSLHPQRAERFFVEVVAPREVGVIPSSLPDRLGDLYFLNLTESIGPMLSPKVIEEIVIPSIQPYLLPSGDATLHQQFEASHSVMLSIFASPRCAEVGARMLPFYVDAIFKAFPSALSARQFRLAYSTLVRECSSPQPISSLHPNMVDVLHEILCERVTQASTQSLPAEVNEGSVGLSEKDVEILALVDSLPFMEVEVMHRWLEPTANLVNAVEDEGSKQRIRERLWDVLSAELDVSRAEVAVRWWSAGGRELVLFGGGKPARDVMVQSRL
ncbi:hypothetical protein EDC01DRAFT_669525 [Geopyxis carbonaria]|nr:hypothetical protein EDC01DRAFT_669525 [Geopyxis carbonaria]